jgi:2-dehydropantoate 2-reductase
MPSLRHVILGAGGIGGLLGAWLARAGSPVNVVVRPDSMARYPGELQLESPFGNFRVPVSRSVTVPPCDVVWLAVKATQLDAALQAIEEPESVGAIVPLLNGIDHIALLRAKYGAAKIIPATIAVESERVAPGHIIHRSPFARLNVSSSGRDLLAPTLDEFQKVGFECRFIVEEPTLLWSKLVFLAPLALSTTAAGLTVGGVLADRVWRELRESCVREACAVAISEGATVDAEAVIAGAGKVPPEMRSSMQKDVEQRSPPELDAIAGPILRGGQKHGIPVPATQRLVALVEERVRGGKSS